MDKMQTKTTLVEDNRGEKIQGFSPNPTLSFVPVTLAPTETATTNPGEARIGTICFRAVGSSVDVYLNGETTKFMTFDSDYNWILVLNMAVTSITWKNNTGITLSLQRWGM